MCRHPEDVKASVQLFQFRIGLCQHADHAWCAMLNVEGRAHADLALIKIRQHGIGGGPLHEADHVRRGVNRRQFSLVMAERVPVLNRLFRVSANTQWNLFCHAQESTKLQCVTASHSQKLPAVPPRQCSNPKEGSQNHKAAHKMISKKKRPNGNTRLALRAANAARLVCKLY